MKIIRAIVVAIGATCFLVPVALAQWPTTCVELNDQSEAALGNSQNVGIYQKVFKESAETYCQSDHREDVRNVFAWAIESDSTTLLTTKEVETLGWGAKHYDLINNGEIVGGIRVAIGRNVFGDGESPNAYIQIDLLHYHSCRYTVVVNERYWSKPTKVNDSCVPWFGIDFVDNDITRLKSVTYYHLHGQPEKFTIVW